jgi:preprotein translocase subunit SecD
LIIGIGIAVDANIILFEKFKEELKVGVGIKEAINNSSRKTF